jgi:hypothetical protein
LDIVLTRVIIVSQNRIIITRNVAITITYIFEIIYSDVMQILIQILVFTILLIYFYLAYLFVSGINNDRGKKCLYKILIKNRK